MCFFDEIDAIGKKRDNRSDEREQTLNALLSEMSGFGERDGVVVVAATNRLDTLDEALLRAGRFDRQIEVPLPGLAERLRILQVHARGKPLAQDVSLEALARDTALFSGAKLECLLNAKAELQKARQHFGLVFQNFNLFPHYSVLKNITEPPILIGKPSRPKMRIGSRMIFVIAPTSCVIME